MTKKLHRFLSLAMSFIMVLSLVSVYASADPETKTYKLGDTFENEDVNATLPTLTNPALAWSEPVMIYSCHKEAHTHSTDTCSYREKQDGETLDFSMHKYYRLDYVCENTDSSHVHGAYCYGWVECSKEEYDKANSPYSDQNYKSTYLNYVWTCGKEAHTHTDDCKLVYQWTVTKNNLNEHEIRGHIKVNFTNIKTGFSVSDVSVVVTYASGRTKTVAQDGSPADDGGLMYTDIHTGTYYAIISNNTDDKSDYRIVSVAVTYTYDEVTTTYTVNTFDGLEAARLACPNKEWGKSNGLDFTIAVELAPRYYYTITNNYYLDDQLVGSEKVTDDSSTVFETRDSAASLNPDTTSTYNNVEYAFDETTSKYVRVNIESSKNDSTKAVDLTLNYRRYSVAYEFVSGTDGKTLPAEVKAQLPESTSLPMGDKVAAPASDFTTVDEYVNGFRSGTWTFDKWDKDAIDSIKAPVTFKGTWLFEEAPKHTYTLTYVGNGGVSGTETTLTDSENVTDTYATVYEMTADNCEFTLDRYAFQGWAETKEDADAGKVTVKAGDAVEFSSEEKVTDKTLYAVWKQVEFSITVSNSSTGYKFKDGDTISYSVAVNGTKLKDTYTATYSAKTGWTGFTAGEFAEGDVVTITELSPHKNNYVLSVSDANGNHVAAKKGDYAQTLTITDSDTTMAFANAYTPYAEEYTPAPVVPVNPTIPTTGDSVSTITVAVAMILMSAVVAFVAMRKREN